MDSKLTIGENIKRIRKSRGFTQSQLADKANISRSYLADLERNRYNPSLSTLVAISAALNIEATEMMEGISGALYKNVELSEKLRLTLMSMSIGPIYNRVFTDKVLPILQSESHYLEKLYNVKFVFTPDGITELCESVTDEYFTVDVIKMLETAKQKSEHEIETIAAHHDGEEWTEEELEEIARFKEFVRMKRAKDKQE
ncbi:helix-turn-helix domain-containing protein [Paenibacillus apiarius]|uniref:helix-turn-helix domain-containing protein n=1 Tax=Paenibacillus apiarius TaxID=46240 RepID=UPI003B3B00FC